MIVRMKLVPRGNESSDNPPTLNLPGCRKPLAVVCVRDRCWTPSCRWTVCTRCSNLLRANLSFFFFSFFPSLLFVSLTEIRPRYLPSNFVFFFFNWHVRSFIRAQRRYTLVDNYFSCIIYNIRFFFLSFFFFSLSNTFLQIQTNFIRHGPIHLVGRNLLHDFKNRFLSPSKKKREEN